MKSSTSGAPNSNANEPKDESADPGPKGAFQSIALEQSMGTYLPATVAFRLINFGRIVLLAYFMTEYQFGMLSMVLLVVNVMTPLCSFGLNDAIVRYVPQYEQQGSLAAFLQKSFVLLLMLAAIGVMIFLWFSPELSRFFYAQGFIDGKPPEDSGDITQLTRLSGIVIGLMVVYFYLMAVVRGLRMFGALSRLELLHGLLFLLGGFVAVLTDNLSALVLTACYAFSLLIPIVYYGLGLYRIVNGWQTKTRFASNDRLASKLLWFSIWTALAGMTWQVLLFYPVWFLNKIHGPEDVAVFTAIRQIAQFILIGGVAVSAVVMTNVTKTWESEGKEAAERKLSLAFRGTGLGLLALCTVLALGKDFIILIYRPEFEPGSDIMPLQLLFFLMGAFLAFLPGHFHLREKTWYMVWPWIIGIISNALLAFWLAGPNLHDLKNSAIWTACRPFTSAIFTEGFSELGSAAWCGVFAMAVATSLCVMLIRARCSRLDRGTYIVLGSSLLLTIKWWILLPGSVVFFLVVFRSELIFQAEERRMVLGYISRSLGHVPLIRTFKPPRGDAK